MKAKRSVVIVFAVFLQVILWVNLPVLASTKQSGEAAELESMIRDTVGGLKQLTGVSSKYVLEDSENMKAGTSICDWVAMVLALSGEKEAYDTYVNRLEKYVTESYKADGYLKGGATEYERISLTLLALGRDPLEFGTDENGNSIPFLRDGTYGFREKTLGQQGLSGYIYGLLLLDAMNYEVPKDAAVAREDMLAAILDAQSEEGGFSIDGNGANVDMTAMALQALAPYAGDEKVHASIEKALDWLYEEMTSYGTFVSGNVESCESTAQLILAMCALDVDVRTDTRFEKNGTTLWKGLQAFRLADGTYVHSLEETEGNLIATEQALLALEAVQKRATEGRWIWDFEGYVPPESAQTNGISKSFCLLGIGMLVLLGVGVVAARTAKKRRVNGRKAEGRREMYKKTIEIRNEVKKVIVGKDVVINKVLMAILAQGHVLLEDVPGVGKTTLANAFAKVLGLDSRRVQFTSDTMPSDIIGFSAYDMQSGELQYKPGAIMTNLILADEINRTSSKTQSALLEAMEERQVTVDGITRELPSPFIVLATQNPIGSVGTQLLPPAQLDRFLMKISMGYPDMASQIEIMKGRHHTNPLDSISAVVDIEVLQKLIDEVTQTHVEHLIYEYISKLVEKTRENPYIQLGISPRGALAICSTAKACAYINGRDYVIPQDVADVFVDVGSHRMVLSSKARLHEYTAEQLLGEILGDVSKPDVKELGF